MRTKSENYLKGDEICLESKLKNIPENKSLSPFPMIMLKCSLSYWMMTNLKRSITIEHLELPDNTWLPPLCSHLLASPCQSGPQPQPKEMSSRIDKEPRTLISKYLFFCYLPQHIYDRHIEVWGYLDVTLAAGWFQFTVFCLYDKSLKTGNEILREMSWIHLKTFSIISVTSKWMESSKLVFPRPKFFKVFIENLRVVDILSEWVPCQCCLRHFIYWFWYLSCAD